MVCDHTEYYTGGRCRLCGGPLSGYDTRKKRFAVLSGTDGDHPVEIIIHRAYCRECGRIVVPEEPFYAGTRIGSPVVDLCQTLASSVSGGHVTGVLERLGVSVDRWSVRSYCHLPIPPPRTIGLFGMQLPASVVALSSLAGDLGDDRRAAGDDILAACNFPSRCSHMVWIWLVLSALLDIIFCDGIALEILAV
jgi:hypothetical protein